MHALLFQHVCCGEVLALKYATMSSTDRSEENGHGQIVNRPLQTTQPIFRSVMHERALELGIRHKPVPEELVQEVTDSAHPELLAESCVAGTSTKLVNPDPLVVTEKRDGLTARPLPSKNPAPVTVAA